MILGIVLCGGKSSRMGSDKGLIRKEDSLTWAEAAYHKLQRLDLEVFVSIHPVQKNTYRKVFPSSLVIEDELAPVFSFEGPLRGLLSVHRLYPEHDIFSLACDMQELPLPLLEELMETYQRQKNDYEYFCFQCRKKVETSCAILGHRGLRKIYYRAIHGQLFHHGLLQALTGTQTRKLLVREQDSGFFHPRDFPVST